MSENTKKGLFQSVFGGKKSDCCNVKIEEIKEEPEKKSEAGEPAPCCGGQTDSQSKEGTMDIKILGVGCPRCIELEKRVIDALAELGIAAGVEHVTELKKFASMGVFMTPGLVIDGKVVAQGKVPSKDELKKLLGGGK